jgi:hypothetical protein
MRELLNIIDIILEATNLSPSEMTGIRHVERFKKFIDYIENSKPFTIVTGGEVILDPSEAERFQSMYDNGTFKGIIKAKTIDGNMIPLGQLVKTTDFGGAAAAAGSTGEEAGKEAFIVKPSQIGITDKNISAKKLPRVIQSNEALLQTDYGQVIIQASKDITDAGVAILPKEYTTEDKEKIRKAIIDYAGEYLGVQALIQGVSDFPKRKEFIEWLGTDLESLTIVFPGAANNNLADSFASIKNNETSHTLNISSKGTGGGAAPAISGLKIPDRIVRSRKLANAIKFINICKNEDTITQAFSAMDLIYSISPKSIDKKWHKFLPFSDKTPNIVALSKNNISYDKKRKKINLGDPRLPAKFQSLVDSIKGDGTDGGKLVYGIKREVANAINNNDAIPEFKNTILEILEMNFVQQYTSHKKGKLIFSTQWPAKLDGNISVENKSSTTAPAAGGFSFKLGKTDSSVSSEPGEPKVTRSSSNKQDLTKGAKQITTGRTTKSEKQKPEIGDVGRAKRK